jgi:hypothetical protein
MTNPRKKVSKMATKAARVVVPLHRSRSDREGTKALTVHVAEDIHRAVANVADREHLTHDELLHLAIALILERLKSPPVRSLDLKLKQHRLTSYLVPPAPGD